MDLKIPPFALLRYGTVIVRLRMERFTTGRKTDAHRTEGFARVVHRVSSCEQCTRTRIVSQYSDCDSALVGKCWPYRRRAVKSRYVNVCAAVCLLLLVGGLTPQSSAAPHRTRNMDRSERAADQENETWSNPCDYNKSVIDSPLAYHKGLAEQVAKQSRDTLDNAKAYKDEIAKLHSYNKFEDMVGTWSGTEWLRNYSWFCPKVLPEGKEYGKAVDEKQLNETLTDIDEVLPILSKALKMLGAGLRAVSNSMNHVPDSSLQRNLLNTSEYVRHVLCLTSELIRARNLKMLPLYDSEIPEYTEEAETVKDAFLIYRDTINFLEYIDQLFVKMSKNA